MSAVVDALEAETHRANAAEAEIATLKRILHFTQQALGDSDIENTKLREALCETDKMLGRMKDLATTADRMIHTLEGAYEQARVWKAIWKACAKWHFVSRGTSLGRLLWPMPRRSRVKEKP